MKLLVHRKRKKLQFTYTNLKQNPAFLVGKSIKHKWDFTTNSMFLKGKIIGITPNETMPVDSDTDIRKDETGFDIQNTNQNPITTEYSQIYNVVILKFYNQIMIEYTYFCVKLFGKIYT